MRSHRQELKQLELQALPGHVVFERLKDREADQFSDSIDAEAEQSLLNRGEPIIDLGLALYGRRREVAIQIWSDKPELRIALLSNRLLSSAVSFSEPFPIFFLGRSQSFASWLGDATDVEREAIFQNPTLDYSVMGDIIERHGDFSSLKDELHLQICGWLSNSEFVDVEKDFGAGSSFIDGYSSYLKRRPREAFRKLLYTAPVTGAWAGVLAHAFRNSPPYLSEAADFERCYLRWSELLAEVSDASRESLLISGPYDFAHGICSTLSRAAIQSGKAKPQDFLASADINWRHAAYEVVDLSPEEITLCGKRDGAMFVIAALRNELLFSTEEKRSALRDACRLHDYKNAFTFIAEYRQAEKELRDRRPSYFRGESDRAEQPAEVLATRSDVNGLASRIGGLESKLSSVIVWGGAGLGCLLLLLVIR